MRKFDDLTGKRFGQLTVVSLNTEEHKDKRRYWNCRCDCGNERVVLTAFLNNGATTRCKLCCKKEKSENAIRMSKDKHGMVKTHSWKTWRRIRQRCYYPKINGYANYGGRGISVCDEWNNCFESFRDWAFENGYKEGLSIDRIDVNGNYEPSNCRWVSIKEQANNKRNSHVLEFNGQRHTISEWAETTGINKNTIRSRIEKYGWIVERALTVKPINGGRYGNFDK